MSNYLDHRRVLILENFTVSKDSLGEFGESSVILNGTIEDDLFKVSRIDFEDFQERDLEDFIELLKKYSKGIFKIKMLFESAYGITITVKNSKVTIREWEF
jgi:hypothetical protein